jgi:hypothetical protein
VAETMIKAKLFDKINHPSVHCDPTKDIYPVHSGLPQGRHATDLDEYTESIPADKHLLHRQQTYNDFGKWVGTLATLSTYRSRNTSCLPNSLPLITAF